MNLKKIGKVLTSKSVGTGPYSHEKRIYRAAVSQKLGNTALVVKTLISFATSLKDRPVTRCHISHLWSLQPQHCENLKVSFESSVIIIICLSWS